MPYFCTWINHENRNHCLCGLLASCIHNHSMHLGLPHLMYSIEKPPPCSSVLTRMLYALVISEDGTREPTVPKEQPAADSLRAEEEGRKILLQRDSASAFTFRSLPPHVLSPSLLPLSFSLFLSNQPYYNHLSVMINNIHKTPLLTEW